MKRELLPNRPRRDRVVGRVAHRVGVRRHPLAVKCRQQQAALAQMLRGVEEQRRPRTHERAERTIGLAGMKSLGIAEENFAHGGRVAGEDEGRDSRYAHGEPIAVAARAGVEEAERIADEVEGREEFGPGGRASEQP